MKKLNNIYQHFVTKLLWLYSRFLITFHPAPSKEDVIWNEREKERKAEMKKKHLFLFLFEKIEAPLMIFGFFFFIFEPLIKIFMPTWLYAISRAISGGAMGLGFSSWMINKNLWKMLYFSHERVVNVFKQISEALEAASQVGKKTVN